MVCNGQLHAQAVLPLGKEHPLSTGQEAVEADSRSGQEEINVLPLLATEPGFL